MTSTTEYETITQQCSINNSSTYLTKQNIFWYTEYVNNSAHEQHVTENFGTDKKKKIYRMLIKFTINIATTTLACRQ